MDTKQNPSELGVRGTGIIEEKDGVRIVKDFRFDSISLVANPEDIARIQDGSTVEESLGYKTVPDDSPRRGKSARGDNLPFIYLDDFAFLPSEALNKAMEEKIQQLGISRELIESKEKPWSMSYSLLGGNRAGKASGFAYHRHGFLYHMMPEFPLGTSTQLFQKRSFDYELIGGL